MSRFANSRVTIQCEQEAQVQAIMRCLLDTFDGILVFGTDIRDNTRPPYTGGKHCILNFQFIEDKPRDPKTKDKHKHAVDYVI